MPNEDFPQEMYVNVCDRDSDKDDAPIFAAQATLDEIPEDCAGENVAVYVLREVRTLGVKKSLA